MHFLSFRDLRSKKWSLGSFFREWPWHSQKKKIYGYLLYFGPSTLLKNFTFLFSTSLSALRVIYDLIFLCIITRCFLECIRKKKERRKSWRRFLMSLNRGNEFCFLHCADFLANIGMQICGNPELRILCQVELPISRFYYRRVVIGAIDRDLRGFKKPRHKNKKMREWRRRCYGDERWWGKSGKKLRRM